MRRLKNSAAVITAGLIILQQSFLFAAPIKLSLAESIDLALKNNPAIQIAQEDKERSLWGVSEAKAGKLPSISFGSSYSFQDRGADGPGQDSLNSSLRMSWQLYNGGRTEAQIKQAELGVTTADINVLKAKQQLILDTTTAYYSVLLAKNMLAVNEETVNNLKAHLEVVQAKYEAGTVAKSDVLRAEVELANAEQNLIKAQNQYELAVSNLLTTMNMDAGTDLQLEGELQYQPDPRTLAELIAVAKQNRPEIAQAKASIESAESGVKIAESGKLPTVSLSATTGWNDSLLPSDNNWSVGLAANWNLFDAGVTKAKIKEAEAALDKANLQAEQVADTVEQEVRQSYLGMKEAEKRLATTETAVNKAKEDLYIAQEAYKVGVRTNLDVIDAQLALTQAKTNHVQALYDYNVNKAKLDKAVGLETK
ncbi:TolC family protein [Sporolituus thermophilus]|uniref:Type I secretion outer membrane protein, TolC family n=1 Tax=Sporolituus thermophilus DSM 23256 TaxID=1123285 RepID=A0A1G7IT62_9FIRM|nr:TolC family protein [Sporolituus thermophilus]SDF15778.1 type I secretion outer membrane protein, TolC family [Sporolituus thermophilus DSM 23256]